MTITEFLEARIAEDEAGAMDAVDGDDDDGVWAPAADWGGGAQRVEGRGILIYDEGGHTEEQAAHIARWDPARVLAECAAKRAILEEHRSRIYTDEEPGFSMVLWDCLCSAARGKPCPTVGALAAVYAGHPDYDKDWAL